MLTESVQEALMWVEQTLKSLCMTGSSQVYHRGQDRDDATLLYEVALEFTLGVEPRLTRGTVRRQRPVLTVEMKERLKKLRGLRRAVPRAHNRSRREIPMDPASLLFRTITRAPSSKRQLLADEIWRDICTVAELLRSEVDVMELYYGRHLTLDEIAQQMKVSRSTVMRRLRSAELKVDGYTALLGWGDQHDGDHRMGQKVAG